MIWAKRGSVPLTAAGAPILRRSTLQAAGAAGLMAAVATTGLSGRSRQAQAATTTIVSWASAGQRWEFPQKGVYPLFQRKFPGIDVQIVAEPIADMLPKTAIALASKSDRYDVIFDDYNFSPQFIAERALESLEPYLDRHPEYKKDIFADIPENVLDRIVTSRRRKAASSTGCRRTATVNSSTIAPTSSPRPA